MTKPTIHTNGTHPKDLLEENMKAWRTVNEAVEAVSKAGPNARDYYVQGDTAFEKARKEHRARIGKLVEVADELMGLLEHLADNQKEEL